MLQLVKYPNKSLNVPCVPVTVYDLDLQNQINAMCDAVEQFHGYALAANQVGFNNRIFVISDSPDLKIFNGITNDPPVDRPKVYINPIMLDPQGETRYKESCLSMPGVSAWNKRYDNFTLVYQDRQGNIHRTIANGLFAIVCQHEMEHLDGKLFVDKLDFFEKAKIQPKLNKLRR